MNEPMVEVSESKKSLKCFDGFGNRLVVNSFHLPLVHGDYIFVDDVTKELDFRLVELTLLSFEKEMKLSELLGGLPQRDGNVRLGSGSRSGFRLCRPA